MYDKKTAVCKPFLYDKLLQTILLALLLYYCCEKNQETL